MTTADSISHVEGADSAQLPRQHVLSRQQTSALRKVTVALLVYCTATFGVIFAFTR